MRADRTNIFRDTDFITDDGTTYEVKTDTWAHKSGNLFFETSRDTGRAGCFYRSKADYWVYIVAETGDAYIFRLSDAQAWLIGNLGRVTLTQTRSRNTKGAYSVYTGFKVPLADFLADVRHEHIRLSL